MVGGTGVALKVVIAVPNEGHTLCEAYPNRMLMMFHLGKLEAQNPDKYEFNFTSVGRVLTPLARERLTEYAVDGGCDLILMVDDDMVVPLDLFECLHKTMVETNADIVAPLAFMRVAPHFPVIYRLREGYDGITHKPYYEREIVRNYPKDSVVECDAVGFGAALIKLDMVKRMKKPWFMSTTSHGEDIWFCRCAKEEAGAKIVMDTRIKLGHLGNPPLITEETYEKHPDTIKMREVKGDAPKELAHV